MSAQKKMIRVYDRVMTGSVARRYYEGSGFFNFGHWAAETKSQRAASEALVDQLAGRLPDRPGSILDVACGLGASSEQLGRRFGAALVTGINISEGQITRARARCPGSTFAVMDATDLRFQDAQFDGVICVEAAFHFDTRDRFLREAFRVLKPGGVLVLSDILFRHFSKRAARMAHVPRANHFRDIAQYRNHVAAAGFIKIDITDASAACLGPFCRNLAGWPMREYRAGRMKMGRAAGTAIGCAALAGYFRVSCKSYLLVSAEKPAAP
jgi:MPBQ/MSBQ methyltransferase